METDIAPEVQQAIVEHRDNLRPLENPEEIARQQEEWCGKLGLPAVWRSPDGTNFSFIPPAKHQIRKTQMFVAPDQIAPFYLAQSLLTKCQLTRWLDSGDSEAREKLKEPSFARVRKQVTGKDAEEWATHLSIPDIQSYVRWISSNFGIQYTLPSEQELGFALNNIWEICSGRKVGTITCLGLLYSGLGEWTRSPYTAPAKASSSYAYGPVSSKSLTVQNWAETGEMAGRPMNIGQRRGDIGVRFRISLTVANLNCLKAANIQRGETVLPIHP